MRSIYLLVLINTVINYSFELLSFSASLYVHSATFWKQTINLILLFDNFTDYFVDYMQHQSHSSTVLKIMYLTGNQINK